MAEQKTAGQLAASTGMQSRLIIGSFSLLLWLSLGQAEAGCYQLFDQSNAKIYEGNTPPFDISYPGNSPAYQASRARGEYMMIMPANFCEGADAGGEAASAGSYSSGSAASSSGAGSCAGRKILYGPRGGAYCITASGQARYLSQD